jgi:hypothetical protein
MSKEKKLQIRNSTAEFLVFTSQATIRNFNIVQGVNNHFSAIRNLRITQPDGFFKVARNVDFYNHNAIIFESDVDRAIKQLPREGKKP